jgi:hypothetical protein
MSNTAVFNFSGTLDNTIPGDSDVRLVSKDADGGNKVVLATAASGTSTSVSGTLAKDKVLDIENDN